MIALTQEKREEKIKRLNKIASWADSYGADHNVMISALEAKEMAEAYIASLKADIFAHVDGSGLNFYRHPSATIEHAIEQGDQVTALYISPPVPNIKRPDLLDIPDGLDLASAMAAINWYEMEIKRLNGWEK